MNGFVQSDNNDFARDARSLFQSHALGSVMLAMPLVARYSLTTVALGWFILSFVDLNRRTVIGVATTVAGVVLLLMA